jgi:hypothetical protein
MSVGADTDPGRGRGIPRHQCTFHKMVVVANQSVWRKQDEVVNPRVH